MATPISEAGTIIRFEGSFDVAAAQPVIEALATLGEGSEIDIDLTRVLEFDDRAVAALGVGLAGTRACVSVRGLRRHAYTMLRYLGIRSAALEPAGADATLAFGARDT